MGEDLIEQYPSVYHNFQEVNRVLTRLPESPEWDFVDILSEPEETSRLDEASFSQPVTKSDQIALVDLLLSWGIRPIAIVGHSSGIHLRLLLCFPYHADLILVLDPCVTFMVQVKLLQHMLLASPQLHRPWR